MNRLIVGLLLPVVCEGINLAKIEYTPACFQDPVSSSQLLRDIRSIEACAHLCENNTCQAFAYRINMSDCYLLNAMPGYLTSSCGCELTMMTIYGKPTTSDALRRGPYCLPGGCTNNVDCFRLCDGGGPGICDPTQGRLEVFYNGEWGTVCDDRWTSSSSNYNAEVTCKMFGYRHGTHHCCAEYGEGTGPIFLDNVECDNPHYDSPAKCNHSTWGSHNCDHGEDIAISCY